MGRTVADARELTCETRIGSKYPQVMVNLDLYNKLVATMSVTECEMKFAGEDFGFFSLEFPSALFWLGTRAPGAEPVGLHHPAFLPPDEAVALGIEAFWRLLEVTDD
jgi:N-acetyldiaminopimelate deacetylase